MTNLAIRQGSTFTRVLRWEVEPVVFKTITAITQAAPARITAASHGLATGWRAAVESVGGMVELNALHSPPWASDYHTVTVVDPNTITLDGVNSSRYTAYTSGGVLRYYTPQSLGGCTARMAIKDMVGGTVLHTLTTENGGIALDDTNHTITLTISAADTAAFTWTRGVWDLEVVDGAEVNAPFSGTVTVEREVTT